MRRMLCGVALSCAILFGVVGSAGAVPADKAGKCVGSASLMRVVGDVEQTAKLDVSFRSAVGVPGDADYEPASGTITFKSTEPGMSFSMPVSAVDITDFGIAWASGTSDIGLDFDVLIWDQGTPGAGVDEVYIVCKTPEGNYPTFWSVTSGNLLVRAK